MKIDRIVCIRSDSNINVSITGFVKRDETWNLISGYSGIIINKYPVWLKTNFISVYGNTSSKKYMDTISIGEINNKIQLITASYRTWEELGQWYWVLAYTDYEKDALDTNKWNTYLYSSINNTKYNWYKEPLKTKVMGRLDKLRAMYAIKNELAIKKSERKKLLGN